MQFSKLRLSGFKSFVDPSELTIEPGVTGIVGPNGCGKSNLVEALRWVMGETSAKRMRGGEMDDVIFSGSVTRPSRNLAEVTLQLDNGDRSAPAQFNDSESLEIVRRIERGSGSNYRINGRDVRARDVQLLFADSATGAHSPALVSQGRIGALINAKPTDRRKLLEEAAGITGLHSRRHEAELRLKAAETNLERLDDVIATLETQYQALKRQARQASRYRNLAGHIRRHEAILLHLDREAARSAIENAKAQLAGAQAAVAALTGSASGCAAAQSEAAAALPELRQKEAEAAAALQRLLVERDNLDREEAQAVAARQEAEQRLAQIHHDQERAGALAEDAAAARQRLEQERGALEAAAANEGEAAQDAEEQRRAASEQVGTSESRVDTCSARLAEAEARNEALQRRLRELEARLEKLRAESSRLAEERRRLSEDSQAGEALRGLAEAMESAEQAQDRARDSADSTARSLSQRRSEEESAREALRTAEAEAAKLQAEAQALSQVLEPAESDVWPPVIDSLAVEPGYEAALGAALGDDLQASPDEGAPVHWRVLGIYSAGPALPGESRPLSQQVRGAGALARRLAQIGVVPDAETGRRLQAQLTCGQRLVTREGDLWRWDGYTIRAGAPTPAATRLAQRNRLAELRRKLEAMEPSLTQLRQRHEATRGEAERAAAAERGARAVLSNALTAAKQARERHRALAEKTAATQSRLAAIEETGQRLAVEQAECEQALSAAREESAGLPNLEQIRAELAELRTGLGEARRRFAECEAAVERIRRESESRAGRLAAIEHESSTWARRAEEIASHRAELETRHEKTRQEIEALAARPVEIARQRDALAEQIELAEGRRKAAADALAEGETRLAEADRALKAEEAKLAEARENRVRAEAASEQAEVAIRQLAERVREKLECGLDEILAAGEVDPDKELPPRDAVETKLTRLLRERDNMGPVNLRAEQEAEELEQQISGLQNERADLVSAIARLRQGIGNLNREGRQRLLQAFEAVNEHFTELFVRLFGGGRAHLALTEADDPLEAGLEIMASPPGKRLQVLSLLSGGEQALTALALLFAVFLTNPAPICVLDEVDAPLDDSNVDRFCVLIDELAHQTSTRFLVITHHRMTMARVDRLFGVTMAERGVSQLVSVDLEAAESLRESA
ncbi:MAG: AAA family ATPase [Kiloniellales bacterium]|nr:AAA family ATPase [Kiloniellales bacterium]